MEEKAGELNAEVLEMAAGEGPAAGASVEGGAPRERKNGHLTSGKLLARNTVWNLIGTCAPMGVAVFSIPILIRELGKERFGILTLAWALIGYANLFDLGLGRALTQVVAKKLGAGEDHEIPALAWTSLALMLLLGVAGAGVVGAISPWLVHRALNVPTALHHEALVSFYLLGVSLPFVITSAGLRGLLEAHQRFGLINALRVPLGVFTFAAPLLVLPFSRSLVPVVATLAGGRIAAWGAYLLLALRTVPSVRERLTLEKKVLRPLFRFGGWVTLASVVNPILVSMDRFIIGAVLPVAMVGYYTAPFEAVTKLWLVPTSLTATMFPACSALFDRKAELVALYSRSIKYLFLIVAPISLVLFVYAGRITQLWLGPEFARNSTMVLRILTCGVFVNCFAHIPFCFIQALGKPEAAAKLFLAELVPYAFFVWVMVRRTGIVGAAEAWSIRAAAEVVLLVLLAWRICSLSPGSVVDRGLRRGAIALVVLGLVMLGTTIALHDSFAAEIWMTVLWLTIFALVVWKYVLDESDRRAALELAVPIAGSWGRT